MKNTYFSVETYHGGRPVRSEANTVREAHALAKGSPNSVVSALREGWLIRDFHFSPKHPLPSAEKLEAEIVASLKRYDARKSNPAGVSYENLTERQLMARIAKAQQAMSKAVGGMISVGLGDWKQAEIEAERGKGNKWIDAYLAAWDAEKPLYAESYRRRSYHGSLKPVRRKNPAARGILARPEFAVAVEHFKNSVGWSQQHSKLAADSLARYGDHGPQISGVIRDHFPALVKSRLRELAKLATQESNLAWKAKPLRVRDSTMRSLAAAVAKKYGAGFYGPQPRGSNPVKRKPLSATARGLKTLGAGMRSKKFKHAMSSLAKRGAAKLHAVRKARNKNPMSAQARKDFALRMKRAREVKQAGKRLTIKRQIRHGGRHIDPDLNTKTLRTIRRATQAAGMYNIAALAADKRLAWWSGNGFSLLRGNAQGFASLAEAKKRAGRLEKNLVAGLFRSDVSAERARDFLLGKR